MVMLFDGLQRSRKSESLRWNWGRASVESRSNEKPCSNLEHKDVVEKKHLASTFAWKVCVLSCARAPICSAALLGQVISGLEDPG